MGLLGQDNAGEDGVEGKVLIARHDPDRVEPLVEAVEELGGEIHLGDDAVDADETVGEEFYPASVFGDGQIALLEVAVLAVEDHEASGAIGKEIVTDLVLEGDSGGGADDMITHGIRSKRSPAGRG